MIILRDYIEVSSSDTKKHILAEMHVDSSSELPSREFGNYILETGSIAHDVSTGDFYAINSEGTWHKQDGSEVSAVNSQKLSKTEVTKDVEPLRDSESE